MASERRDKIDDLLDRALAQYASREPRPGLEGRVLSRVRAEGAAPRRGWLRYAVPATVAVAASLLGGAIYWSHGNRPQPRHPAMVASAARRTQPAGPAPVATPRPVRARRSTPPAITRHAKLPKLSQFPTLEPLSKEERAWLAFVRRSPEQAAEAIRETPPTEIQPIRIEAIQIPPIDIGETAQ